jgi:succinoglycan biosynthesis transport protein ExoP
MQLAELFAIIRKRRWLVILMVTMTVGAAAVVAVLRPPVYESTASLALTPKINPDRGFIGSQDLNALLSTYAETAKSQVNLARAQQMLGRPLPGEVETSTVGGTGILRITGRAASPEAAATTANAAAEAFSRSVARSPLLVVNLVNSAQAPESPVQPRPPLIIAISAILGLLAAVALALLRDRVNRRVETPADVAAVTDVPVVARLPRQRALQRGPARLIWENEKLAGLQESYRALRTNIEFLAANRRLIEVTSPEAAQGKSTLVANLGVALGQVGIETVIVDGDMRRPQQHEIFGLDNREGLSTTMGLRGTEPELKPSGYPGLWVLTSGPSPPDPTEMLHIRFASFAKQLRSLDALVLVDTPPVLPVSDARLIASHCDGVLLVVAAGWPRPAALANAIERLSFVRADLLGIVLNQTGEDLDTSGGYYYAGRAEPQDARVDAL